MSNVIALANSNYVSGVRIIPNEALDIDHVRANIELIEELSALYADQKQIMRDKLSNVNSISNEKAKFIALNEFRHYKANFRQHVIMSFEIYQGINKVSFCSSLAFRRIEAMVEKYQNRHLVMA